VERFLAERRILARLDHPGIASLIDGGVDEHHRPWFVMQYIDGATLPDYCRAHQLGVEARLRLFIKVCEAVAHAHRQLVVHCDLKPSNILVDGIGQPHLLDFGIARLLAGEGTVGSSGVTLPHALTPGYAAPEQLLGEPVSVATDVYALGMLLHELLVGTRPRFGAGLGTGASAPLPASRSVGADGPTAARRLRGDLDLIVATALRREPLQRYPGADALAEDVRRHLDGHPLRAHRERVGVRMRKFVLRHRVAVAVASLAVLALLATTVLALVEAHVARDQVVRAQAERGFLVGVFEQADPDANKGQPISAHQLLESGERQLAGTAQRDPALHSDLTALIGRLYWDLGDYARAQPLLERAVDDSRDPAVPDDVRARGLLALARSESQKNLYDLAINHAVQALAAAQHAGRGGIDEASEARRIAARARVGKGDAGRAETDLRDALASDRAIFGPGSQAVIDDLLQRAYALKELSRYDEAIACAREAIDAATALHGRDQADVIDGLETLASAETYRGDAHAAEIALREAAAIAARIYGPQHRETLVARSNLYLAVARQGRYAEARDGHLALLVDTQKLAAARPEQLAYAWNVLASDYNGTGEFDSAANAARVALTAWMKVHGVDDTPDSYDARANLVVALTLAGRYAEAESNARELVEHESKTEPASSIWLAKDRGYLANAVRLGHRPAEAAKLLRTTIASLGAAADAPTAIPIYLRSTLSEAELDAGDVAQAGADGARALAQTRAGKALGGITLGMPLFALGRARLAQGDPGMAAKLLHEALMARSVLAKGDPRVLEIDVELVRALAAQGNADAALALRDQVVPILTASRSLRAADLRARLDAPSSADRPATPRHTVPMPAGVR
jgi:serine/threonine-protein kinase